MTKTEWNTALTQRHGADLQQRFSAASVAVCGLGGLGSNVASITAAVTTSGSSERTDNPFDLMITGDSFFIVNNGGVNYFTKCLNFIVFCS